MRLPRRILGFIVFAFAVSLGCLRLGAWQLTRLAERRARNAIVAARLQQTIAPMAELHGHPDSLRYRPVMVRGWLDYQNEMFLTGRARSGSPGVFLLSPLRRPGIDTAVLVVRGWIYAPDGKSVDLSRWHEGDSVEVTGFVDTYVKATGVASVPNAPRGLHFSDRDSLQAHLPYPIADFLIVQTSDSAQRQDHPARLLPPVLDDGPHRSYAIQWFVFALIAWVGIGAVIRKGRGAT